MRSSRRPNPLWLLGLAVLVTVGCGSTESGTDTAESGSDTHDPWARTPDPHAAYATADTNFHLAGWLSPPMDHFNATTVAEMKRAGLDIMLPPENDRGVEADNLARLDLAATHGMRCLLVDERLAGFRGRDDPNSQAIVQAVVDSYRDHRGLFGYYLGDEPRADDFDALAGLHSALRASDPVHPAYNNLLGRLAFRNRNAWLDYTRDYLERVEPKILCNDQYDFLRKGDRGQFVENAAGLCALARQAGLPAWGIIQLVEHGAYRAITEGELKWQVSMWLVHGAKTIVYFTYWTPAPNPKWDFQPAVIARDGSQTEWYGVLRRFNPYVRQAGDRLATLAWQKTEFSGSVPRGAHPFAPDDLVSRVTGRAALGRFADREGRPYVMVANSDSASARTIGLDFATRRSWQRLDEASKGWEWAVRDSGSRTELELPAGGFAVLRFDRDGDETGAGGP